MLSRVIEKSKQEHSILINGFSTGQILKYEQLSAVVQFSDVRQIYKYLFLNKYPNLFLIRLIKCLISLIRCENKSKHAINVIIFHYIVKQLQKTK